MQLHWINSLTDTGFDFKIFENSIIEQLQQKYLHKMSRDQNHQTFGGWIYQKHLCLISNEEKRGHRYTLEYWLEVHPHCVDSTWLLAIKKYSDNVVRIGSHRPCWRMSDATLACALIQSTHFKCPFATISDGLKGRDKEQGVRAAFISHILALDSNQRWTIALAQITPRLPPKQSRWDFFCVLFTDFQWK